MKALFQYDTQKNRAARKFDIETIPPVGSFVRAANQVQYKVKHVEWVIDSRRRCYPVISLSGLEDEVDVVD